MDRLAAVAHGAHVDVYRILDDAMGQAVPSPGLRGDIHAAIDDMRRAGSPNELVVLAETISLNIHQIEWARRDCDLAAEQEARRSLSDVAVAWLNFRILN